MITPTLRLLCSLALTLLLMGGGDGLHMAHAQVTYRATVALGALLPQQSGNGPFALNFRLTDGGTGLGNNNSSVDIFNVLLTGATFGTIEPRIGNAQGNLTTLLTLRDGPISSGGVADFTQNLQSVDAANATLRFDFIVAAQNVDNNPPDTFAFRVLDGGFEPIATNSPTADVQANALVLARYLSTSPVPVGYAATDPNYAGLLATVEIAGAAVPEASPLDLLALGLAALGVGAKALQRHRRRKDGTGNSPSTGSC